MRGERNGIATDLPMAEREKLRVVAGNGHIPGRIFAAQAAYFAGAFSSTLASLNVGACKNNGAHIFEVRVAPLREICHHVAVNFLRGSVMRSLQ